METKKTVYQLRVTKEYNKYNIVNRQGVKIADFVMPRDRQVIRDVEAIKAIMAVLEIRYGLRKEKIPASKSRNTHDLFFYQVSVNGYFIYKGNAENGNVCLIGRVMCPHDNRYEIDKIALEEILHILDQRIYWK